MTPSELALDTLKTALSYAPLGVRDAALRSLGDVFGGLVERPLEAVEAHQKLLQQPPELKLLSYEAERRQLQGAVDDAAQMFREIAGDLPRFQNMTYEQIAREWLMRHYIPEEDAATAPGIERWVSGSEDHYRGGDR